jgi:hypothetical protein
MAPEAVALPVDPVIDLVPLRCPFALDGDVNGAQCVVDYKRKNHVDNKFFL